MAPLQQDGCNGEVDATTLAPMMADPMQGPAGPSDEGIAAGFFQRSVWCVAEEVAQDVEMILSAATSITGANVNLEAIREAAASDCKAALNHATHLRPRLNEARWPVCDADGYLAGPKISIATHYGTDMRYDGKPRETPLPDEPLADARLRIALGIRDARSLIGWRLPAVSGDNAKAVRSLRREFPVVLHTSTLPLRVLRAAITNGAVAYGGATVLRVVRAKLQPGKSRSETRAEMIRTEGYGGDVLTLEAQVVCSVGNIRMLLRVLDEPIVPTVSTAQVEDDPCWPPTDSQLAAVSDATWRALLTIETELGASGTAYMPYLLPVGPARRGRRTDALTSPGADDWRAKAPEGADSLLFGLLDGRGTHEASDALVNWVVVARTASGLPEPTSHTSTRSAAPDFAAFADEVATANRQLGEDTGYTFTALQSGPNTPMERTWLVSIPTGAEVPASPLPPAARESPRSAGHISMLPAYDKDLNVKRAVMDALLAYALAEDVGLAIRP